jgi:hypothetical protein
VAFAFPGIGFIAQQATRLIYVGGADSHGRAENAI